MSPFQKPKHGFIASSALGLAIIAYVSSNDTYSEHLEKILIYNLQVKVRAGNACDIQKDKKTSLMVSNRIVSN